MPTAIKLSDLAIGASGVVREMPKTGAGFVRLREMGLVPGTTIMLMRAAPMGDPLEIKVRGYNLTLRKSEAGFVLLETTEPVEAK